MLYEIGEILKKRLAQPEESIVHIHGRVIVVQDKWSFLAESYEAYLAGQKLRVDDDGKIASQLSLRLAPYGGGMCSYDEEVWIEGQLTPRSLTHVTSCRVVRDNETIDIKV